MEKGGGKIERGDLERFWFQNKKYLMVLLNRTKSPNYSAEKVSFIKPKMFKL